MGSAGADPVVVDSTGIAETPRRVATHGIIEDVEKRSGVLSDRRQGEALVYPRRGW
jgi:hypothetical protein